MASFIEAVNGIRRGALTAQLSDRLTDVVSAVQEHSKVGELTLKLRIKPNGEGAVTITPTVTAKAPEGTIGDSIFFADEIGNLHRRDPRQGDLEDEIARRRDTQGDVA